LVAEPVGEPGAKPTHLPTTDVLGHVREGHTMRKTKVLAGMTAGLMLLGTAAFATAPTITIDSPADGATLTYTSFPQTVEVEGTISRTHTTGGGGNHNLCGVKDLTVTVHDGVEAVQIGYLAEVASGSGTDCPTLEGWAYDWEIEDAGIYTIRATAVAVPSQESGDAEAEVLVEELTLIAAFPAAPAVAAELLQDAGVSARYGSGRTGGNHIADVAHEMGPGTDFHGVSKRHVAEYREAVEAFLDHKGALG
jgi:hypothetical protein